MPTYGFTYFPDDQHYRPADAHTWLPELRALGASWLVLWASPARAIPEAFITALRAAGLEPVVDMPVYPIQPTDPALLTPLLQAYARWGVRYVHLFPPPNSRAAWPPATWGQANLVERFLALATPLWQEQRAAGLVPVFPALQPGGDYWDMAFLDTALEILQASPHRDLLNDMVFAMLTAPGNRPLNWGEGGPARWPQTRPYLTPPGSQDQRGFHAFEWYQAVITARLGQPRPLLSVGGGVRRHDHTDPALPPLDDTRHATCTLEIVNRLAALPADVLNVTLGQLSATPNQADQAAAFYPAGQAGAAVTALRQWSSRPPATPKSISSKPLKHYVLLPMFAWGVSEWHWKAAFTLLREGGAVCGCSPAEAALAEQVTVLGNAHSIADSVLTDLRAQGCQVRRAHYDPLSNPT